MPTPAELVTIAFILIPCFVVSWFIAPDENKENNSSKSDESVLKLDKDAKRKVEHE
jgi:hypothetical protein